MIEFMTQEEKAADRELDAAVVKNYNASHPVLLDDLQAFAKEHPYAMSAVFASLSKDGELAGMVPLATVTDRAINKLIALLSGPDAERKSYGANVGERIVWPPADLTSDDAIIDGIAELLIQATASDVYKLGPGLMHNSRTILTMVFAQIDAAITGGQHND